MASIICGNSGVDSLGIESRFWTKEFFSSQTRLDRHWGPPNLLFNGYRGVFPGVKWSEPEVNHSPIPYEGCPESIKPFWISREPVAWPCCKLAASKRRPYSSSVNRYSPVRLISRQWDAVDWACVLCDCPIHNDRMSRSANLHQCACPFYSSRLGLFFCKTSYYPGLSVTLQPTFGHLRLPFLFPNSKIAVEIV